MYGWIQQCIESLVLEKFGAETWAKIKAEAACSEIPVNGWVRHESYEDQLTLQLVGGASKILGIPPETVLTVFGEYFIVWLVQQGYKGFLKSFGGDMLTFLQNMNRMHANLKLGMPDFVPPILACQAVPSLDKCEYLELEYKSHRTGLATMMLGIIKGCAEQLFASTYECTLKETINTSGASGNLEVSIYHITFVSGASLVKGSTTPFRASGRVNESKKAKSNYNFFQHNPNMAQGWVESVLRDVDDLTEDAAQAFGAEFDVHMIISLIKSFNPYATKGLRGLFRKPLCNKTVSMPVPTLAYVPETRGRQFLECRSYPSIAMTADVTFGHRRLLRVTGRHGYHQEPVEVYACACPNLHTNVSLLKALCETPNDSILCCPEVTAILQSAWYQVLPKFVTDISMDVSVLTLLTVWIIQPNAGYVGWPLIVVVAAKEVFEEILQLRAYLLRGWAVEYISLLNIFDWARLALNVLFIISIITEPKALEGDGVDSRYPLGLYACHRWWRLLFQLRAFESMGPKLLPIMYAVMSLGPFTVVFLVVLLGFAYLIAALETFTNPTSQLYTSMLQAAFLPDIDLVDGSDWVTIWLYIVVVVVGVILVNILIGVLSESYDLHQDNHQVLFNRERANLCVQLSMCMFPRKVDWKTRPRWLGFLIDIVSIESADRACGEHDAFLWFYTTRVNASQASRLRNMKDHVSAQTAEISRKIDESSTRNEIDKVKDRLDSLDQRFDGLESYLKALCPALNDAQPPAPPATCIITF